MSLRREWRKANRIRKLFDATIERKAAILHPGQTRLIRALVIDVSRDGLGLVAMEPFERQAQVRVTIEIAEQSRVPGMSSSFASSAVVRDCGPFSRGGFRIGVQLLTGTGRELDIWGEFIKKWTAQTL
jgi:hypothetical protein